MPTSTLIQDYATAVIKKMAIEAAAISKLEHDVTKGHYRELVVHSLLRPMLSIQFGIGAGVIVNQAGAQSPQQDVIVYDRRILPPFIEAGNIGVFPIESVIATFEVKSHLNESELRKSGIAAEKVGEIANSGSIYGPCHQPLSAVIGFGSDQWLSTAGDRSCKLLWSLGRIWSVCCVGKYVWLRQNDWESTESDDCFRETKLFIAVMLDNMRTHAEAVYRDVINAHHDWFSVYLREDSSGSRYLRGETKTWSATTTPGPYG